MMHELPLNGRNFTELLILQPGVNPVNTAQGGNGVGGADGGNIGIPNAVVYRPSVNGAGNRSNAFYMDGIINTDDRGGGWAIQPIADTIQEFKVQSHNNDAQYGNVLGAVVNIVTKSGTNKFHGSAWEFARSQIFDARNPFTGFCSPASCRIAGQLAAKPGDGGEDHGGAGVVDSLRHAGFAARILAEHVRRHVRRADHPQQDVLLFRLRRLEILVSRKTPTRTFRRQRNWAAISAAR